MKNYFKNDVILVRYPFTDPPGSKVRPAVIVSTSHPSKDIFVVPLTSKTQSLFEGEFLLEEWAEAGLNVPTAIKRGLYAINRKLILKKVGKLNAGDSGRLEESLRKWLGLD
ncbi:type II toxin-antitoxin system PemK/MazF family toxin [candidate division KSB1 bacterium]|nr:type II toxin-antitoxin system PemK/MazF family toxin [candidate division KSB1 bacterium]